MKKKRMIIILAIIIISIIAIMLGIYSRRNDDGNGLRDDVPKDIKVEEMEEELIIIPEEQEELDMQEQSTSKNETVESNIGQGTEHDVQEDSENGGIQMGPNELPFVPAE